MIHDFFFGAVVLGAFFISSMAAWKVAGVFIN